MRGRKAGRKSTPKVDITDDVGLLDKVMTTLEDGFNDGIKGVKAGDIVKVIDARAKARVRMMNTEGVGSKEFWSMVNRIRYQELGKKEEGEKREMENEEGGNSEKGADGNQADSDRGNEGKV
jgi:hypothetical protein